MGAINIKSNSYEYPLIASKTNKYKCPHCNRCVIFKKGKIKQPHFAHYKSENPCHYYDRPNEDQIHKDGKSLMRTLLTNKHNICFYRKCSSCHEQLQHHITFDHYTNSEAVEEYRFDHNNSNRRKADVALLQNGIMTFIFEIYHTSRTEKENRPEPWVEIDAENLITIINTIRENNVIQIECIRYYTCESCIARIKCKNKELERKRLEKLEKREKQKIESEAQRLTYEKAHKEYLENEEKKRVRKNRIEEKTKQKSAEHLERIDNIFDDLGYNLSDDEVSSIKCKCIFKICSCSNPTYKLSKSNNHLFCSKCNFWKCRCCNI
jgi:methyltransferase-like protein